MIGFVDDTNHDSGQKVTLGYDARLTDNHRVKNDQ